MIGLRTGLAAGIRSGIAAGISEDTITQSGIPGVSRDGSSGIYCPASASEWTALMAYAGLATGNPSVLWLCQESSGNLADSIGTFTGTVTGTGLSYRQAVPGWSRLGIKQTTGTSTIQNIDVGLPDISTTSCAVLTYFYESASNNNRTIQQLGATAGVTAARANVTASSFHQCVSVATSTAGSTSLLSSSTPFLLKVDRTGSTNKSYSRTEKLAPAFQTALAGQLVGLGMANSPTGFSLYTAVFFGAAAELTDAQTKTLLQTLGWAIPWS